MRLVHRLHLFQLLERRTFPCRALGAQLGWNEISGMCLPSADKERKGERKMVHALTARPSLEGCMAISVVRDTLRR